MNDSPLKNWVPYKLMKAGGQMQCYWLNTYGERFTEPFFEETILRCRAMNSERAAISSISDLMMIKEWAPELDPVEPAAFIFHISRCGSTLISQLLAMVNQHIVLSEAPFFDDILRLSYKYPNFDQTETTELLAAAIKYYGQKKIDQEVPNEGKGVHLFIKTDSWHLFFYKQLRQLYPSVPFILMYRRPDEVFSSQKKTPGMQAVPGLIEPQVFGFKPEELVYDLDIHLANVLERYLQQCFEITETDNNCLLLNYNEGTMQMIKKISAFTNISFSPDTLHTMEERSRYHSKRPDEQFSKKALGVIPASLNKAMMLYDEFEKKRMGIH